MKRNMSMVNQVEKGQVQSHIKWEGCYKGYQAILFIADQSIKSRFPR